MKILELKKESILKAKEEKKKNNNNKIENKVYNNIIIEEGKGNLSSPFRFFK